MRDEQDQQREMEEVRYQKVQQLIREVDKEVAAAEEQRNYQERLQRLIKKIDEQEEERRYQEVQRLIKEVDEEVAVAEQERRLQEAEQLIEEARERHKHMRPWVCCCSCYRCCRHCAGWLAA